jgi:hypothetical protein
MVLIEELTFRFDRVLTFPYISSLLLNRTFCSVVWCDLLLAGALFGVSFRLSLIGFDLGWLAGSSRGSSGSLSIEGFCLRLDFGPQMLKRFWCTSRNANVLKFDGYFFAS